jgi:hypothetical protein
LAFYSCFLNGRISWPRRVIDNEVDAQTDESGAVFFKILFLLSEPRHFGGAYRCKIRRVGEEDRPLSLIYSENLIVPVVVMASKSGALSPMRGADVLSILSISLFC